MGYYSLLKILQFYLNTLFMSNKYYKRSQENKNKKQANKQTDVIHADTKYLFGQDLYDDYVLLFFFFFSHAFQRQNLVETVTVHALCMNSNQNFLLFSTSVGFVHCSRDPQTSFFATFSLKIGYTTLFTHLKFILIQYF